MRRPGKKRQRDDAGAGGGHGGDGFNGAASAAAHVSSAGGEAAAYFDGNYYGQAPQPVYTPEVQSRSAEAGPSRIPMGAASGVRWDSSAAPPPPGAPGDGADEEEADDDENEDDVFGGPLAHNDIDDSADEYRKEQDDDELGSGSSAGSGDEDNDFPAAPDVNALRLAEQLQAFPALASPSMFSTADADPAAAQESMLDPALQHQSRYRAGGLQRIEELGYVGADEDVQVGEDEIARLVAAIQGDEQQSGRKRRGQISAGQAQAGTSSSHSIPAPEMRQEPNRQPQIRSWDKAMIQEREDFEEELRNVHGMKRKRNKRTRYAPRKQALSEEIKELLYDANTSYVMGEHDEAIASLHEIISIEPYARAAWTLLMLCFREKGQDAEAIQAGIILASLSSSTTAVEMFKELADSSRQLGARQQAIYCLQQAIVRSGKTDTDAMWDRAVILEQLSDNRAAARGYAMVVALRPWDSEAKEAAIRLFFARQEYKRAAELLETVRRWTMDRFPDPSAAINALGDAPDPVQLETMAAASGQSDAGGTTGQQAGEEQTRGQSGDGSGPVQQLTYTERDLYSHVEFLLYAKEPVLAINVLRETVRWLQGRGGDSYWDDLEYDDREFDEVRPGRDLTEQEDSGRKAFDRSSDLLAAGRRKWRNRKEGKKKAANQSARSRADRDADDDADDDNAEDDNQNDEEDDGAGAAADDGGSADGELDHDEDNAIELAARRRQWEAWESCADVYGLSPSLRVLLGRARLMIGDEDEAERQFSVVLEHDVTVHSDLFADVAQAYMEYGYWQEALDVLSEMDRVEELRTAQYYEWLGTCCQNLGQLQQAVKYLQGVVDARPSDLSVRYQLAEIYAELGDNDNALRLAASLVRMDAAAGRRAMAMNGDVAEEPSNSFFSLSASAALERDSDEDEDLSLSKANNRKRPGRRGRPSKKKGASGPTANEKLEAIRELEYRAAAAKLADLETVLFEGEWWRGDVSFDDADDEDVETESTWQRFKRSQQQIRGSGSTAAAYAERKAKIERARACKQWLDIASNLVDGFKNRKGMFKRDAKAPLLPRGMGRRGRHKGTNIHSRATALLSRLQDRMLDEDQHSHDVDPHGLPEFRGIHFDDWAILFIKYGCVLSKIGEGEAAVEHMRLVASSYTMQLHDQRRLALGLGTIACALHVRDFDNVFAEIRSLMNHYIFHEEMFRLKCSLANLGGIYGLAAFMNRDLLKYLLRRVRQFHAVAHGSEHFMRYGKWTLRTRFGKARHLSNLENRQQFKKIPLGFAERVHELVPTDADASTVGKDAQKLDGRDAAARAGAADDDDDDDGGGASKSDAPARLVPEYASLADVRPDRPGWMGGPGTMKTVTLQDVLRCGYPSRPSVVAEAFYGKMMLLSRSNIPALYLFTKQYTRLQSDPLICLLCAVAFLARALNRQVDNRHHAVLQAFAYLGRYRRLRAAGSEEVEYNMGRAFHQIGLLQQATYHYEKVLTLAEAAASRADKQATRPPPSSGYTPPAGFASAREAAFNLSLIYAAGGSPARARALYARWLVV